MATAAAEEEERDQRRAYHGYLGDLGLTLNAYTREDVLAHYRMCPESDLPMQARRAALRAEAAAFFIWKLRNPEVVKANAGKWVYVWNGEVSDEFFDTDDAADNACCAKAGWEYICNVYVGRVGEEGPPLPLTFALGNPDGSVTTTTTQ